MAYYSLEDMFKMLNPSSKGTTATTDTTVRPLREIIQETVMDPRGIFHTYQDMHREMNSHFEKKSGNRKDFKEEFHVISSEQGNLGTFDFGDADYWNGVKSIGAFIPDMNDKSEFGASAFVVRSPYVNPSTRGTGPIDLFLNSTPTVVASQMVPYLDVEFELRRNGNMMDYVSTPSLMRFLLGSVSKADLGNKFNNLIEESGVRRAPGSGEEQYSRAMSGMEMFLMPQTLTNMDYDTGVYTRIGRLNVRQKPFVPFASIESLDISAQNAGAGKFAHRKGTLKMKIHDKARLSEMSDFLRPQGYHRALLWTTYGWLAPRNRGDEEEYCSFINDNMLVRECWSIVNTQYGFDAAGQVQLTLELMSKGGRAMQGLFVTGDKKVKASLDKFHHAIQGIQEFVARNSGNPKFSFTAQATQVINSAATDGVFTGLKEGELAKAVGNIMSTLKTGSGISEPELKKLELNLKEVTKVNSYEMLRKTIRDSVADKFNSFGNVNVPDPFLPSNDQKKKGYWSTDLIDAISQFSKTVEERKKAVTLEKMRAYNKNAKKKIEDSIISISDKATIVSFGKLFLSFVLPEIRESQQCDEVQVFFYALNDQCGPVSGHSIAEFPIDVTALAYSYAEVMKTMQTDRLSIETFLKLVIETQFTDQRAIGYGMGKYFKPFDRDKPSQADQRDGKEKDATEKGLNEWIGKWGAWRPPMIEMTIETGEDGGPKTNVAANLKRSVFTAEDDLKAGRPGQKKIIMRIHIYDKQNNPYRLLQSIISAGDGQFEVGYIDKSRLNSRAQEIIQKLDSDQQDQLIILLQQNKGYAEALKQLGVPPEDINGLDVVQRPGKDNVVFKTNAKVVKEQIKRFVPSITPGVNGTMITSANASSKSDGLQGAINIMRSAKGFSSGKPVTSADGLQNSNGLPLTIMPIQLNMTSYGIPTLQLYQSFFVDLGTGTNVDNVYTCSQIQHSIAPGKFSTNLTFIYADGYPKFGNPPALAAVVSGQLDGLIRQAKEAAKQKKKPNPGPNKK